MMRRVLYKAGCRERSEPVRAGLPNVFERPPDSWLSTGSCNRVLVGIEANNVIARDEAWIVSNVVTRIESQAEPTGFRPAFSFVTFADVLNALKVLRRKDALIGDEERRPQQGLHTPVSDVLRRVHPQVQKNQ